MIDYKVELDRIMKIESEGNSCPPENKLQFLGNYIFNFTTYDSYIDELFANSGLPVECDPVFVNELLLKVRNL